MSVIIDECESFMCVWHMEREGEVQAAKTVKAASSNQDHLPTFSPQTKRDGSMARPLSALKARDDSYLDLGVWQRFVFHRWRSSSSDGVQQQQQSTRRGAQTLSPFICLSTHIATRAAHTPNTHPQTRCKR
jgi:hypothetical protein